ncbi:MAG: phosphoribosylglycinamide formyltransferase [Bacteroidia bacterium]
MKKRLAIFASGTGSNAVNFIEYFKNNTDIEVALVLSNNNEAPVLQKAESLGVETIAITNSAAANGGFMVTLMASYNIHFIVLAGYLRFIPKALITEYNGNMVNIHPSLLPKYGGKGMYGSKVHQAVIDNNETESGITIHLVNEIYDDGEVVFQTKVGLVDEETPESLAQKVHQLEHEHFPKVVEQLVSNIE